MGRVMSKLRIFYCCSNPRDGLGYKASLVWKQVVVRIAETSEKYNPWRLALSGSRFRSSHALCDMVMVMMMMRSRQMAVDITANYLGSWLVNKKEFYHEFLLGRANNETV